MGEKPRVELLAGLAAIYQSRDWSDLVLFSLDGSRHPVHRAIVCPRSSYISTAVKEGKWRDGVEGHLLLPDHEEVVRLLIEYLYLLDYEAGSSQHDDTSSGRGNGDSDTMSIRTTDASHYGHVYGTSAVSAFGGPTQHPHSPFNPSGTFRTRPDSSLTVHAMPGGAPDFAAFAGGHTGPPSSANSSSAQQQQQMRRRKTGWGMAMTGPEPSPLATKEPHLVLHANMYAAGDRYSILGLKALALDKFKIQLTMHWDSPELAECINIVYESTPSKDKDMREAVADALGWYPHVLDKPEIEEAILDINGLAYELLKRSRRAEPEYN